MSEKKNILEEASGLIYGDRNADYGHPYHDFTRTAKMITGLLQDKLRPGEEIDPHEVGLIMILVKCSREQNKPKRDNLVDIAGYAGTVEMVREYEALLPPRGEDDLRPGAFPFSAAQGRPA